MFAVYCNRMAIHTIVLIILVLSVNSAWLSKDYKLEDNDPLIADNHNKATYYLVNGFTKAHAPNYANVPVDITKIIQSFTYEPYVMTAQCTMEFPNIRLNEQQIAQIEESIEFYVYAIGEATPPTSIQFRKIWSVEIKVDTLYNVTYLALEPSPDLQWDASIDTEYVIYISSKGLSSVAQPLMVSEVYLYLRCKTGLKKIQLEPICDFMHSQTWTFSTTRTKGCTVL
eukprot:923709_1